MGKLISQPSKYFFTRRSRVVRPSAHDWKSCNTHKVFEGSNPSFSATSEQSPLCSDVLLFLRNKRTSSARFLAPPFQITTTSLRCDLGWETKISGMKPLDKEGNLFCLPGQERFPYYGFHTMPKCAIIKQRIHY